MFLGSSVLIFIVTPTLSFDMSGFIKIFLKGFILAFNKVSGWGGKRKFFCFVLELTILFFNLLKTESPDKISFGDSFFWLKKPKP